MDHHRRRAEVECAGSRDVDSRSDILRAHRAEI